MLNRRLLRVKVMQALYGLKQAEKSDYFLSLDYIADVFAPDLNSMEPQNLDQLRQDKETSQDLFSKLFTDEKPELHSQPDKIRKAVIDAKNLYSNRKQKDQIHYRKQMLEEIERVYENYILGLDLIKNLVLFSEDDEEEEKNKYIKRDTGFPVATNLRNNQVFNILRNDAELEKTRLRLKLSWDREMVRRLYKDEIKQNEEIINYLKLENPGFDEDRKILNYTAKNIIFKNQSIQAFFEERDFNWIENQSIVKSLVSKTIKSIEPDTSKILVDISGNWEEDKVFFEDLYKRTIEKEDELEGYISGKTQNWEMERIAMTDNIILKMALAEMISFPSIPVKVSINEYIELSKTYSTPKSKQYVNGMLDTLSQELIKNNVIRKSGRGLIDNK
jgi:transcription antitermination protein NusB